MSEVQKATDEEVVIDHLKNQRDTDSLTDSQLDLYLEMAPTFEFDEEQPAPSEEQNETVEQEETDSVVNLDNIPEFDKHKEYQRVLAEKNKFEQIAKNEKDRFEKMKQDQEFAKKQLGLKTEIKVDPEKDYLDDQHQAKLEAKIEQLQAKLDSMEEETKTTQANLKAKEETLGLFGEIERVQNGFKALKTSEPFQSINDKLLEWKKHIISAGLDEDRYYSDKEYRKALDAKGYKLDVKEQDIPKMLKIYDIHSSYKKEKEQGYNTSFERAFRTSNVFEEVAKSQFGGHLQADDDALNAAIERRASEPQILNTGSAPAESAELGDLINEQTILVNKTRLSPADERRLSEIEKAIEQHF